MKAQPVKPSALLHRQAVDHFRGGRMAEGITVLKKALELDPGSGEMHSHLAIALFQTGDPAGAAGHFEKSARLAPRNPEVLNDCGAFVLESNRPQEAEKLFRRALDIDPNYAEALLNLGRSLVKQGRSQEAEGPFLAALRINPRRPEVLYNLGMICLRSDSVTRHEQGRKYLDKALAVNPKHEQAWSALVESYERASDYEMEGEALERALKRIPQSLELAVLRMNVLLREGKKDEVPAILEQVSQKLNPSAVNPSVLREIARGYDETGEPQNAMKWFRASSEAQKKTYEAQKINGNAFLERIEGYRKALGSAAQWRPAPPLKPDVPCPVFLVGFPRSGTTLLDQIFSGHPDIEVAEEKPALRAVEIHLAERGKRHEWEMLNKLDDAGIEAARDIYFAAMKDDGCALRPDGVFIDKLPLHIIYAPLVMRLFPDARFILALRHPCDCVLSNYMQRFSPNNAMVHMIDLITAAKFYDSCFSAWEDAVRVMNLPFHIVKYEDVVEDLKGEIVKALDYLGLDWQDSVAAFDETAKKRQIGTPSRRQVTQKLYTRARGRWHKYREYMGDVPEMLRPWAEKFGYEID